MCKLRCVQLCLFVAALLLAACSKTDSISESRSGEPVAVRYPQAYGVYAWHGGEWVELRQPLSTVGIDVFADVKFLVHDKRLGLVSDGGFKLVREHFLRNLIVQEPGGGEQKVVPRNVWESDGGEAVGTQVLPVQGQAEMVIIRPRGSLEPGVYGLEVFGQSRESISVGAPGIFREPGRDAHCLDIVRERGWGWIKMGVPDRMVPCALNDPPTAQTASVDPSSSATNTPAASLDSRWIGTWKTGDGNKTIEISAEKMTVVNPYEEPVKQGGSPFRYELAWTLRPEPEDGQFAYAAAYTSNQEILKWYEDALASLRSDPVEYTVDVSDQARQAIHALSGGGHLLVKGNSGGHCLNEWQWVLDRGTLLEVRHCKYSFAVRVFTRVADL